jgi:hypothetical protein
MTHRKILDAQDHPESGGLAQDMFDALDSNNEGRLDYKYVKEFFLACKIEGGKDFC